ncbi:MAG: site-specific integrase [Ktedonobacteraceae bacterium]
MTRRTQGEGSVYMRKDGRAAASAMYEGKRITKYGKTKTEARQKLEAYLDDLKQGKVVIVPKQTVKQYLEHWLENEHRLEIGIVSLSQYRSTLRAHLIPAFGYLQLDQLTREHIQKFCVEKLDSGLAPSTIHAIHALLSAALADAVKNGILARNPCANVILPRKEKKKHHVLTKEQAACLVQVAHGCRLWFLLLMAITTGARIGELLSLRWEDMDVTNMCVHIHRTVSRITGLGQVERGQPKTRSGRRKIILAQAVVDGIVEQKEYITSIRAQAGSSWNGTLDLVFPNKNGEYMNRDAVASELQVLLAKIGLDPYKVHELRHSAATILFAAGVNPKIIQEMLGHSDIAMTLGLYGDVLPDMQQEVANVMNNIFR